ncbi:hypothetical protein [Spirosoma agri]|uniref:Uncharacterized protein n=1 Tax=Spirosoma agri TaxID=1987381 RepID=A0A6M0ILI0_9BACT|nr:hypothetical protein [Spirosoma agri]NEU69004.1 hypothetical protein [Spirosoma agri]
MWYFLIKQAALEMSQYQALQRKASLTEVELFNEPYENWYIFSIERDHYTGFMDFLDREGIGYDLKADRPTRDEMVADMK